MPPSHSYTIDDDGDDSDICPVCDGECTCHPRATAAPRPQPLPQPPPTTKPGVPLSMAELSLMYAAASSPPNSSSSGRPYPSSSTPTTTTTPVSTPAPPVAPKPSLKIKLTVPPSMLAKRRAPAQSIKSYKNPAETTSDFANAGYNSASDPPQPPANLVPAPKKRGRPPKSLSSSRPQQQQQQIQPHTAANLYSARSPPYKPLNPKSAAPGKHPKSIKARQNAIRSRPSLPVGKKPVKKKRVVSSDDESSLSGDSDIAIAGPLVRKNAPANPVAVADFPTFVAASALSSSLSSTNTSDSSSLSEFDSDSSIEAEEENFILANVHDKARIKRELLGDDTQKKRMARNNDWEEDGESTDDHRHRYVGLATGWSEEEEDESSFDADLFFANLSDTDSISSKSERSVPAKTSFGAKHRAKASSFSLSMGEEGDQSDISCAASDFTERGSMQRRMQRRAELEALPFEVTQGWDGQIVFTNGVGDTQNIVDIEFEADASRFADITTSATSSAATSVYGDDDRLHGRGDSDVDMDMHSEGGYEEEDGELEGEGDTTDEELVGENDLPNERAMRLFSLPMSVSAINPLSTVSSPAVSPGRRRREEEAGRERRRRRWGAGGWGSWSGLGGAAGESSAPGPSALDILQGRVVFYDSDEAVFDEEDDSSEEEEMDEDDMMDVVMESSSGSDLETMSEFEEGDGYACDERMIKAMTNKLSRRMKKGSGVATTTAATGWDESLSVGGKNIHIINKHNNAHTHAKKSANNTAAKKNTKHTVKTNSNNINGSRKKKSKGGKKKKGPVGPRQGVFSPTRETRQAVIGDDHKGADVPSPHPRFAGRRRRAATTTTLGSPDGMGGFSAVEHLLRRHLHTLSASISSTGSIADAPPPSSSSTAAGSISVLANDPNMDPASPSAAADERSPLELLLSSVAAAAAASANSDMNGGEDAAASVDAGAGEIGAIQDTKPIQLDDVLEASFLDDPEDTQGASGSKSDYAGLHSSNADANVESGATLSNGEASSSFSAHDQQQHQHQQEENVHVHKNLARWDMISVGAFRQTRESGWGGMGIGMGMGMGMGGMHTPSSSADYGNVMKSSPFGAGRLGLGLGFGGLSAAAAAGGSGSGARTRGSDKLAKRRRIMMGGSTMSSPLILPLGSASASAPASPLPSSSSAFGSQLQQQQQQQQQQNQQYQQNQQQHNQKNRKEQRRERKLMKKKSYGAPHAPHLAHVPHHGQAFHVHHHHHPNAKARSTSGTQRSNFFAAGVPPLNL
ncbi:hypothetical protein CVT25_003249 [Psilocybe cyanescens]|uniref:Uncharacterized protein n=1 Tax=Psilocybe cyanescens TaxID=93625 RepID=A0A409WMC8_PSICY|nr:hypothetical protein CVT25_003249 [Psilocybe cyanescens]